MSTSTTIIISTGTPIGTSMVVKLARVVSGSIIRSTVEMLPMEIEGRPTNLADVAPVVRVALVVPEDPVVSAVQVALVAPEDPVEPVVRVALVAPASPVVLAVRVALVVPESPAALELVPVAVALRAKSVTAAHHPGLVPVPRVEDSAVVAETTRAPV